MSTQEIIEKIEKAPPQMQKEVLDFLDFLLTKENKQEKKNDDEPKQKVRLAGFGKGTFTWVSDDFDEPLDDLKEYM